jgi:hypothetical protein
MSARTVYLSGLGLAAALAVGATGCDPYTRLEFTDQTAVPGGDLVASEHIRLTEGRAIGVLATPMQGSDKMDDDTTLVLSSNNGGIAGVAPSVKAHSFVIFGAAPGTTTFSVVVNDNTENDISVEVVEAK